MTHAQDHSSANQLSPFTPAGSDLLRVGSRRWFLQTGLTGMAGLSLPALLQSQAQATGANMNSKAKSVILIWLSGGPSHIDTWDMKPNAPSEIRGPFSSIATKVPGINICEHLPLQASIMDKLAIIRSVDSSSSNHTPITFQAGNPKARRTNDGKDGGGFPSMGSVVAKFRGANKPAMPAFVALANSMGSDVYGAGQLGNNFEPLNGVDIKGKFDMPQGVGVPRLKDRDALRQQFDQLRKQADSSKILSLQDRYVQEAYNLVLGGASQKAFDLTQESAETHERYGKNSLGQKTLLARRLVESGVSFVTLSDAWGHWDHHGDEVKWGGITKGLKPMLPEFDRGISTLILDLEERGLLDSTLVLVLGEFGRSPVMTKTNGRGHWTPAMSMMVAGGGVQGGQVIGATDRRGGVPIERKVGPGDLAATVFTKLGIDPYDQWTNQSGRPIFLVEGPAGPIPELM